MNNRNIAEPLNALIKKLQQAKSKLPQIAGNTVVNFALGNFRRQGFQDSVVQPWRLRKGTKWGKRKSKNNRWLLVQTGRLRRSIRITKATWQEVVVGSDVPYAKVHNNGLKRQLKQQVKEHARKISTVAKVSSIKTKRTSTKVVSTGWTKVRTHTRTINQDIPARPFLKSSNHLNNMLQKELGDEIRKALKV